MDTSTDRLICALPTASEVDRRIGALLRELHLARRLRRLAILADTYRHIEARGATERRRASHAS